MALKGTILKYPVASYFILTFGLSWLGAFLLVARYLFARKSIPVIDGIILFPIMLIGPPAASLILTSITGGKAGRGALATRMGKWNLPLKWYAIPVLLFPSLILLTLSILQHVASPAFAPNFFPLGFLFGIPAGYLEEIGWTGFALPALLSRKKPFPSAIFLGAIWALWHLPAIDFLGAARPHGKYLFVFFLSFAAILIAVRLIMTWMYTSTGSILLAQFTHAVSTGALVLLGAAKASAPQESVWYAWYAVLLWATALAIFRFSKQPRSAISFAEAKTIS